MTHAELSAARATRRYISKPDAAASVKVVFSTIAIADSNTPPFNTAKTLRHAVN